LVERGAALEFAGGRVEGHVEVLELDPAAWFGVAGGWWVSLGNTGERSSMGRRGEGGGLGIWEWGDG
jgi:hypothetical protein